MSETLYTMIIYPLHQIIEFVYRIFMEIFKVPGFAVIGVSIAVTLLCLPLYAVAEKWQVSERETQKKLKPGIERIKSVFKDDEQYMMLSTFYKQNHYHPMMVLRSSIGLLIQIPFFMATYSFLSNCPELSRSSFLFIRDLGAPDALFKIGTFPVNVLPIAMTLINIIAGAIYTKGFAFREKAQIYGMALVFLVVLYNSPSGLVLYWTMNNVFSLVKNIFYKLKNPLKIFRLLMIAVIFAVALVVLFTMKPLQSIPVFAAAIILIFLPKLKFICTWLLENPLSDLEKKDGFRNSLFIISAITLALLTGFVIPSFLITSSTASDFAYIDSYTTPLYFLWNSLLQSIGLFVIWPVCVYFLFNKKIQSVLKCFFFILLVFGTINAFCFQGDYGNISADLVFTEHKDLHPKLFEFILNTAVLAAIIVISILLMSRHLTHFFGWLDTILLISMVGLSVINGISVQKSFLAAPKPNPQISDIKPIMNFSKTGKNVLVIMLDKAPGYYVEPSFKEAPDLYDTYTGFTFYPNTVSFASWTVQAAPALYGGYEYTPWQMNHKRDISMQEKHNQALSLLPFIFESEGYSSFLIDPPYPNYDTIPVFSFVDGHDNVHAEKALGKYSDLWYKQANYPKLPLKSNRIKRNFLWFSIFKIVPPSMRAIVHYNDWWSAESLADSTSDFIDRYSVLDLLPELSGTDSEKNCFIFIDNEATHDPGFVTTPDYTPAVGIPDTSGFKVQLLAGDPGFHAMVASLKRIGDWINFLKQNDIYDNTRIIIASDHGSYQNFPTFEENSSFPRLIEWFNPMLMVKDFNSKGTLKIDDSFMTQADVPEIAVKDTVKNPVNPFTGNKIREFSKEEKENSAFISFGKANRVRATENNGFIINDSDWYTVKDSIFKIDNWKKLNVQKGELK